ncbi:ABC transporter ATP-binding protein [Rhodoferax aquaticus]|uniref:Sn-glycerol-3-phosphate ABC transporter ATP-binding protein UgpC n=1 Tax=Rhodoferax aquaticus TaxID=2527691 RepID=A0A515ER76_9BURK|nr:sn-glycerol-3-phosphate ABC transporter ATP-binding protein UgpC [Rhodoferax aquaticus]QDL55177.1 sn-glycerol-3-phosphate ABC transporter ATP-binding protein UgpC [Rhodoferax aquaticus]
MATVSLSNIQKTYDSKTHVIKGVDLHIDDGEFVVFVGPSGCGKSTLLRMIAGLEDISAGELRIGERLVNDVSASKRGVAMVFQSYALYPHMTVFENMAFSLKLGGVDKATAQTMVHKAAEILQISHLLERKPKALSGGQRQRVAIGRSIVRDPQVFLFDEPLSNLDASLRVQMRIELSKLHKELGTTMVYVTHDQVEAMTLADRIVIFNGGKIEQVGSPLALYNHPVNLFVASFLGSPGINLATVQLEQHLADGVVVRLQDGDLLTLPLRAQAYACGAQFTLGIRPEHVTSSQTSDALGVRGQFELVEHLGDVQLAYYRIHGAQTNWSVKLSAQTPLDELAGAKQLFFAPAHCNLFDANGLALQRH